MIIIEGPEILSVLEDLKLKVNELVKNDLNINKKYNTIEKLIGIYHQKLTLLWEIDNIIKEIQNKIQNENKLVTLDIENNEVTAFIDAKENQKLSIFCKMRLRDFRRDYNKLIEEMKKNNDYFNEENG